MARSETRAASPAVGTSHPGGPSTGSGSVGTFEVFVAGVALVVASTTLVSDFQGYFSLGLSFVTAIAVAFVINLLLGLSVAELAIDHPRAGALYEYGRNIAPRNVGRFLGVLLAFTFSGMFVFAGAGETAAGAFGLQALFNTDAGLGWFIVAMAVLAVIPNLFGLRTAAWVSAGLLVGMLGSGGSSGSPGCSGSPTPVRGRARTSTPVARAHSTGSARADCWQRGWCSRSGPSWGSSSWHRWSRRCAGRAAASRSGSSSGCW